MKKNYSLLLPAIMFISCAAAQNNFRITANKTNLQAGNDKDYALLDSSGNLLFSGKATYRIGGNKYALLCNEMPQEGLFMNEDLQRWEFRDDKAFPFFTINNSTYGIAARGGVQAGNDKDYGKIDSTGNLLFSGNASYRVTANKYAIQCDEMPQEGLFMNKDLQRWEFRDDKAFPFFTIKNNTYDIAARGGVTAGNEKDFARLDSSGNLLFSGNATYRIKGNKYAILCDGMPQEGLFMNEDLQRWEFRDDKAFPFFTINNSTYGIAARGGMQAGDDKDYGGIDSAGNLRFSGNAAYRVTANKYAIQCDDMPQEGLFMNEDLQRWEFRDDKAFPFFTINNSTYDLVVKGGLQVGSSNSAAAGNIRFNAGIFQGFDGNTWRNFTTTASGKTATAGPVKIEGNAQQSIDEALQLQVKKLQEEVEELKAIIKSKL